MSHRRRLRILARRLKPIYSDNASLQHRRPPFHFPVWIGSIPWRVRSTFASVPSSRLWWRRKRERRWAVASVIYATARLRAIATATGSVNLSAPSER